MDLNDLIAAADYRDRHNTGVKKWARQCAEHQQQEIKELEDKEVRRMFQ